MHKRQVARIAGTALRMGTLGVCIAGVVGCGIFRNREFEYARVEVKRPPELKVPESVSENPTISSKLKVPPGKDTFKPETGDKARQAMKPPGYDQTYNVAYLKRAQNRSRIPARLSFSDSGVGVIEIGAGFSKAWSLVNNALENVSGFTVQKHNRNKQVIELADKFTSKGLDLRFDSADKGKKTTLHVYAHGKPATGGLAQNLLEQLNSQILDHAKSSIDLSKLPSLIEYDKKIKRSVLVIYKPKAAVMNRIRQALQQAGYQVSKAKEGHSAYWIRKPADKDKADAFEMVYVYEYKVLGGWLSDLTNWQTYFRSEQQRTGVKVFNAQGKLLPQARTRVVLEQLRNHLTKQEN